MIEKIQERTLRECKEGLKTKVTGKVREVSDAYLDWFAKNKAKNDDDLERECNRSPEALKKTLEYWSQKHVFTKEEFIANFVYSGLGYRELKEISEAARELSKQKKADYIAELDRLKAEAENEWPDHQSFNRLKKRCKEGC